MMSGRLPFPYEIKPVEAALKAELLSYFHGERTGFVQVGPENYFFPHKYQQEAAGYYNFQARPSDVWVATVPRSGTTWTQELVWLVANNLDFVSARRQLLTERFPFFEFPVFVHPQVKAELLNANKYSPENQKTIEQISVPGYEALDKIGHDQRRFIKTHFPFSLLPPSVMHQQCKVIYVARDPRNVAVSYYHLNRLFRTQGYVGGFPRYWRYFQAGLNPWLPYYSHLKEAQAHRNHANVLYLRYEDMLEDLKSTIHKVAMFLEVMLSSEGVEQLAQHLEKSNFCQNAAVNGHELDELGILNKGEASFVRNGCRNQSVQAEFLESPELLEEANKWMAENEAKIWKSL